MIGCTQKDGRNQCVLFHLAAALVRSENASNRSPPPASRVKMVARSFMPTEAKQADVLGDLATHQNSEWECELASFRHDVLSESNGRDYRSLCIFSAGEFYGGFTNSCI